MTRLVNFLKFFATKFFCKSSPSIEQHFGLWWRMALFYVKLMYILFGQRKLGYSLLHHLVTLDAASPSDYLCIYKMSIILKECRNSFLLLSICFWNISASVYQFLNHLIVCISVSEAFLLLSISFWSSGNVCFSFSVTVVERICWISRRRKYQTFYLENKNMNLGTFLKKWAIPGLFSLSSSFLQTVNSK